MRNCQNESASQLHRHNSHDIVHINMATMAAARSLTKAEEIALSGKNESQDSQLVLDAYMRAYGIGIVSAIAPQRSGGAVY